MLSGLAWHEEEHLRAIRDWLDNMSRHDKALSLFQQGFNCSQSVFSTFAEQMGLDKETAARIACAFGGGMAPTGQTCGAVTGALMAIGLKYGLADGADQPSKAKTYALAGEFLQRFEARRGSSICKVRIGYDISTPEGLETARASGVIERLCPELVGEAVEILEEIL